MAAAPTTIHPVIADLVAWGDKANQTPNAWHGVDLKAPGGDVVRLAAEGVEPGETVTIYRLSHNGICRWGADFSGGTPRQVLAAALAEALAR